MSALIGSLTLTAALLSASAPAAATAAVSMGVIVSGRVESGCRVIAQQAGEPLVRCTAPLVQTRSSPIGGGTEVRTTRPLI